MAKVSKARPAKKPARAVSLCDGGEAEARRLAGVALRKKTIASTMFYAGNGVRASERVAKKPASKKTVAKKTVAKKAAPKKASPKKTPMRKPTAKRTADVVAVAKPDVSAVSVAVLDTADKRRRSRTQSQLIARFVETIDTQLDQIDAIMRDPDRGESGPSDAERHARTVAALARVTVELRKELEAGRRRRADDNSAADLQQSADPDRPRDLDELRERLSRRLDDRLESGPAVSVGDDAAGGNRLSE